MLRFGAQNLRLLSALGFGVAFAACGGQKASSTPTSDLGADMTASEFTFDAKRESRLDLNALNDESTKVGMNVVTIYFEGGLARNCARWDFKLMGEGVAVAKGSKLDKDHQKLLKDDEGGTVVGDFDTRGGQEGLRVVALAGSKLRLTGLQDCCLTKDATDFDVKIDVKPSKKLKRLFTGVESAGQAAVRIRISDEKLDPDAPADEPASIPPEPSMR